MEENRYIGFMEEQRRHSISGGQPTNFMFGIYAIISKN